MGGGSGDGGGGGGGGGEEQVGRKKEGRKTKQLYGRKCNRRTEQPFYADQALLLALPLRQRHSPPLTPPAQIHPLPTIASSYHLLTAHAACPPLSRQLMHLHAMHSVSSTSTAVRIYNRSSNFHRIFRLRPQPRLFPPAPLQKLYISDVVSTGCWRRATQRQILLLPLGSTGSGTEGSSTGTLGNATGAELSGTLGYPARLSKSDYDR